MEAIRLLEYPISMPLPFRQLSLEESELILNFIFILASWGPFAFCYYQSSAFPLLFSSSSLLIWQFTILYFL